MFNQFVRLIERCKNRHDMCDKAITQLNPEVFDDFEVMRDKENLESNLQQSKKRLKTLHRLRDDIRQMLNEEEKSEESSFRLIDAKIERGITEGEVIEDKAKKEKDNLDELLSKYRMKHKLYT